MIRVVLDANVLFSGCVSNSGIPRKILDLVAKHEIILVINKYIVSEVVEHLNKKKRWESIYWFFSFLSSVSVEKTEIPSPEQVALNSHLVPRDKKDVPIVLTALNSNADYLISGDQDINSHDESTKNIDNLITVLSPKEFIDKEFP